MTCGHCTNSVEKNIKSLGGKNVKVNLDASSAEFSGDVNLIQIKEKIKSLGYQVED